MWSGRCNIIKQNVLPMLCTVQTLPIHIPASLFKQANNILFRFVWSSKHPRIKHSILFHAKSKKDLSTPDIRRYYAATHLSRIIDWCSGKNSGWQRSKGLHQFPWIPTAQQHIVRGHPTFIPLIAW